MTFFKLENTLKQVPRAAGDRRRREHKGLFEQEIVEGPSHNMVATRTTNRKCEISVSILLWTE